VINAGAQKEPAPDLEGQEQPLADRRVACSSTEIALDQLELVYAFIYARVGNRADAEDVTQQVALKAIPRLRDGASASAIRGYLFATARSSLSEFWRDRLSNAEAELGENLSASVPGTEPSDASADTVRLILARLSTRHRRVLELRFLRGYSLKEVAAEMNSSVNAIKVMQLRALRAAARVQVGHGQF
jgi:RNA polymerase sigma factor (sigma-70 family)